MKIFKYILSFFRKKNPTIVFFSDTHGLHDELVLPEGDIAICCGDISRSGTRTQVTNFMNWFTKQPHKHKIMICGNHDFWFDKNHPRNFALRDGENPRDIVPDNIIYIEDETIKVMGIKIFGSPWTPWFHDWAFNAMRGEAIQEHWDLIEEGTDIIITHGPPSNTYLDTCRRGDRVGCANLARVIADVQPKICAFGHIHEAYGQENKEILDLEDQDKPGKITKLINCSVLNLSYEMQNEPMVVKWKDMCDMHKNKKI